MVIEYWSVAILFWQLPVNHIKNVLYKRRGLAKTRLRHPSLPFDSLPYPTGTICRRVRTLGQSRDDQTKRGWPYSMSMGLCPTRASRAREPRYNNYSPNHNYNKIVKSDWLSTVLISALIGQLIGQYASCLSNWTVRAITRALKWLFVFTASKIKFRISNVLI